MTEPPYVPPSVPPQPSVPPPPGPPPLPPPLAYPAPVWSAPTGPPAYSGPRTEPFAIVSILAATVGVFFCLVGPVVAIVFGFLARSRIKRSGDRGGGVALAGLILGFVEVALAIVGVVILVVAVSHTSTDANESARTLGARIRDEAAFEQSSPRNADVVRTVLRSFSDIALVGSTDEDAMTATTEEMSAQGWRLEIHHGPFSKACLYLPATSDAPARVVSGACPNTDL